MPDRLPYLTALRAFEVAGRLGSFRRAAEELSVTPAAISHQIKLLEEYLGVELFRRRNRAVALTEAGAAALPRFRRGFEHLEQGVAQLRTWKGDTTLTVSAAPSFAARWLMPRLHRFVAAEPSIDVRIAARMRMGTRSGHGDDQDTAAQWIDDADLAIVFGEGAYPGMLVERLLPLAVTPICSPRLMQGAHPIREPRDLSHHLLLHDDTGWFFDGRSFWDVWLQSAGMADFDVRHGPHFSHAVLALEAAVDGLGVVASMPALAAEELATGKLVTPLALQVPLASAYYVICRPGAVERPPVRAFRDWLIAEARRATGGVKPA